MSLPDGSKVAKFIKGKFTWPFSLTLPTEVEMQDQRTTTKFLLPTAFYEKASTVYVDYKLIVIIKRGFLKVNQTYGHCFLVLSNVLNNVQADDSFCVCPRDAARATISHASESVQGESPSRWTRRYRFYDT